MSQQSVKPLQKVLSAAGRGASDTLFSKISPLGNPAISIIPELDLWVSSGRVVVHSHLRFIIKQLRFLRRFKHALEVSYWMGEKRKRKLSCGDVATRMNLILRVHGIEQVEAYFASIAADRRTPEVYVALLNCYTHVRDAEKAEGVMADLSSGGRPPLPLSYNLLLGMYYRLSRWDRLDALVRAMRLRSVPFDRYAFGTLLSAHAARADRAGAERTLSEMEAAGPAAAPDGNTYMVVADCCLRVGMRRRGLEMLNRAVSVAHLMGGRDVVYATLLKLFGDVGDRAELFRIWRLYRRCRKDRPQNRAYRSMIRSLLRLGDVGGADEVFAEWGRGCRSYDVRIPGELLRAYCRRGCLGRAEALAKEVISRGGRLDFEMWCSLADVYADFGRGEEAVAALREAVKVGSEEEADGLCLLLGGEEAVRMLRTGGVFSESAAEDVVRRLKNREVEKQRD